MTLDGSKIEASIKPTLKQKFRADEAQSLIREVLASKFTGVSYEAERGSQWSREVVEEVKEKLKVIGEMKGEGVRIVARCLWDNESDSVAHEVYKNDSLFCSVAAFAVYYY